MRIVGLDFGTATTLVAEDGVSYPLGDTTTWLPSVVSVDGERLVAGVETGATVLRSVKRAIDERLDTLDGIDADRVITALLTRALIQAQHAGLVLGNQDVAVRLGCPATWDGAQRRRLMALATAAGFPAAGMTAVDEPVAAGAAWLAGEPHGVDGGGGAGDRAGWLLVVDMGGGTLDVAVLRVDDGAEISVLSSLGSGLAGDALDRAIARDLARDVAWVETEQRHWALLERAGREIKERLSFVDEHPVVLPRIFGHPGVIRYDRARLAAVLRPHLEGAQRLVATALRAAGYADPAFDGVDVALLTGGMSRVPALATWLGEVLPGAEIVTDAARPPEEAVVAGLAHPTGLRGVSHLRPGFDVTLRHAGGEVALYEAYTPIYEPWQLVGQLVAGALSLGYQRAATDLPTVGAGEVRVVAVDGRVLATTPVTLGPAGVTLFIGTDTSLTLTDGAGQARAIPLR